MLTNRVALLVKNMKGGGVQHMVLNLAEALVERGHQVDLVLVEAKGQYLSSIPVAIRVVILSYSVLWLCFPFLRRLPPTIAIKFFQTPFLKRCRILLDRLLGNSEFFGYTKSFINTQGLYRYLSSEKPQVLFSANSDANVLALIVKKEYNIKTRIIISIRCSTITSLETINRVKRMKEQRRVLRSLLPYADDIVSVSKGVAENFATFYDYDQKRITTIYNPTVKQDLLRLAQQKPEHPWLQDPKYSVILGVGHLHPQKDFITLLRAFSFLQDTQLRLVILGQGPQYQLIKSFIKTLKLEHRVCLTGWVGNPYAFMRCARVFVLSSRYEGLPNVLIEAMACGCPVVSTDCPSGPREILEDGLWGELVPVGDVQALAQAIERTLSCEPDREALRRRAQFFSVERSVAQYEKVLNIS